MLTDWWSALKSVAEAEPFNIKTEMRAAGVPCHRTGEVGAASATLRTPKAGRGDVCTSHQCDGLECVWSLGSKFRESLPPLLTDPPSVSVSQHRGSVQTVTLVAVRNPGRRPPGQATPPARQSRAGNSENLCSLRRSSLDMPISLPNDLDPEPGEDLIHSEPGGPSPTRARCRLIMMWRSSSVICQ